MDEQQTIQLLADGLFPTAYQVFIKALRRSPQDLEIQAGFYFSGWWNNRTERIQQKQAGIELAIYLQEQWHESRKLAELKGLVETQTFRVISDFILRQIAKNFFSGAHSQINSTNVHGPIILEISHELLKSNYSKEARQLLLLIQKGGFEKPIRRRIQFLIAESNCCSKEIAEQERGVIQLRDLLIRYPVDYNDDDSWICSPNLRKIRDSIREDIREDRQPEKLEKTEQLERIEKTDTSEQASPAWAWLPTHFHLMAQEKQMLSTLSQRQRDYLVQEIERLNQGIRQQMVEKFQERTVAVLCFYVLTLVYDLENYQQSAKMELEKYRKIFLDIAPPKFRRVFETAQNK